MTRMKQLVQLENLRSLKSRQELAEFEEKEMSLREQLRQLKDYRHAAASSDPSLAAMRSIGSDVLWQKWLDKAQIELNMALARLLVSKAALVKRAARDIGRAETATELEKEQRIALVKSRTKSQMESVSELACLAEAVRSENTP